MTGRLRSLAALALLTSSIIPISSAIPSETIDHKYDARGRLIQVIRSGDVNDGVNSCYLLDQSDNRANVTVATSDCATNPPASFSISDATVVEGSSLIFTVTKTGSPAGSHSVNYATTNGSAVAGSDYTATSGTLTFTSVEATKTITVPTTDDTTVEGPETLFVDLSAPTGGAILADFHAVGTINDNDSAAPPSFSIADTSATEGDPLIFTVTKSGSTASTVVIHYEYQNQTAFVGSDVYYTNASGQLTFGPSETIKTINLLTIDDTTVEATETIGMNLIDGIGSFTISDGQAVGTIYDDEAANACTGVSFTIASNGAVSEGDPAVLTVTKSGTTSYACGVNYATSDGTAIASADYLAKSGALSFGPSETSKVIAVTTVEDAIVESTETFTVTLSSPGGGAAIGSPGSATATINDDDVSGSCSGITFAVGDATGMEGQSLTFAVTKSGSTSNSCSVDYATADDTAGPLDYFSTSGTLTFTSSETSKTVIVATKQDSIYEETETFFLNLSNPTTGAAITDGQGVGTIWDDDENPCPNCLIESAPEESATEESVPGGAI